VGVNKRFLAVLVFALVIALGATLLFYRLVASRMNESAPKPVMAQVIVAAHNMEIGSLIREPDLASADWAGEVPPGAVVKKEDLVGRGVLASVYKGEPILESRLAPKGAGAGMAATIPPGMRAVAVRVNEIAGVAGFVVPGMRVDVLISGAPPNSRGDLGTLSKTLLQNIEVLSAGQNIQKDAEGKPITVPVVNLLVTPEQAEILSLAGTTTQVQLVLRNPLDTQIAKTPGTAVANLFSGAKFTGGGAPGTEPVRRASKPKPAPPVVKEKPPIVVEVFQGGQKLETKFKAEPED
jgi:pilus assembly protein CpaB